MSGTILRRRDRTARPPRVEHYSSAVNTRAEGINPSYVSRILRLTLLTPDIVESVLDGRRPPTLTLGRLMKPYPLEWERQRKWIQDW